MMKNPSIVLEKGHTDIKKMKTRFHCWHRMVGRTREVRCGKCVCENFSSKNIVRRYDRHHGSPHRRLLGIKDYEPAKGQSVLRFRPAAKQSPSKLRVVLCKERDQQTDIEKMKQMVTHLVVTEKLPFDLLEKDSFKESVELASRYALSTYGYRLPLSNQMELGNQTIRCCHHV